MAAIVESIGIRNMDMAEVEAVQTDERVWQHPERLSSVSATLRSDLPASRTIRPDEQTRINQGYVEAVRWALGGHKNETAELQGFQINKGQNPDEFIVRHRGPFRQRTVEGKLRREYGPLETSEFILYEASVIDLSVKERVGRYLNSFYRDLRQSLQS